MTQGIRINGDFAPSKKAVREAVAANQSVRLVATSFFGNEFDGDVNNAPNGTYFIVGPDENTRRNFFGQIIVKDGKVTVK